MTQVQREQALLARPREELRTITLALIYRLNISAEARDEIELLILERCRAGAKVENLLALSFIATHRNLTGKPVTHAIILAIENQFLNIYRYQYDEALSLLKQPISGNVDGFYIQENYDFCLAMALIHANVPRYRLLARTFMEVIGKSIVSVLGFEDSAGMAFYAVAQRNRTTLEINKYWDDSYYSSQMYGASLAKIAPGLFGPIENYLSNPEKRIKDAADVEDFGAFVLYGRAKGYDTAIVQAKTAEERFEKRYPFAVNLADNVKMFGFIGSGLITDLINSVEYLSVDAVVNELKEIETYPADDETTVAYAALWRRNISFGDTEMDISQMTISPNSHPRPQAMINRDLADFSWNLMPENWKKLEDKTTRDFHDSMLKSLQYPYAKIASIHSSLNPKEATTKVLDWLCWINGVDASIIPLLNRRTKERMVGVNRAIIAQRSTLPAMKYLNRIFNDDFLEFLIKKPYQPFNSTVYRHTNGNMWMFEVAPGMYTETGLKKAWKALSSSYVSARYLLIMTGLNALSSLGNALPGGVQEWRESDYAENSIVSQGGRTWRRLIGGSTDAPLDALQLWEPVSTPFSYAEYSNTTYYSRGQHVSIGSTVYRLNGLFSLGKNPASGYMMWAEVMQSRKDSLDSTAFYSAPLILGDFNVTDSEIGRTIEGGLNSLSHHLGTAYRYPSGVGNDYSARISPRPFESKSISLGYRGSSGMVFNLPALTSKGDSINRSSANNLLNEGIARWVNLLS